MRISRTLCEADSCLASVYHMHKASARGGGHQLLLLPQSHPAELSKGQSAGPSIATSGEVRLDDIRSRLQEMSSVPCKHFASHQHVIVPRHFVLACLESSDHNQTNRHVPLVIRHAKRGFFSSFVESHSLSPDTDACFGAPRCFNVPDYDETGRSS